MKKEYYILNLNNARYIKDNDILNGCLKINFGNEDNKKIEPFLVVAEKDGEGFIDIVSGRRIKIDEDIVSRGNFEIDDNIDLDEYSNYLETKSEDILSKYDLEAGHILNYYDIELSCYSYRKLTGVEVVQKLLKLDNPDVVNDYMKELKNVENGIIAKEKAIVYLDSRKKMLDKKSIDDDFYAEKYIGAFKSRYKKLK